MELITLEEVYLKYITKGVCGFLYLAPSDRLTFSEFANILKQRYRII
jgi:hypothetical protein